jgi:hypothetical protein
MRAQGRVGVAAAVFACALGFAAAPAHAAGTYTHVVCADAGTGRGVDADGRLPSGMTSTSAHTVGADAPTATRCRGNASASTGVPLRVGVPYSETGVSGNGTLIYRPARDTTIRGATVWMAGRNGPPDHHTSFSLHGGDPPQWVYGPPVPVFCGWFGTHCPSFGTLATPFAAANRVVFSGVPPTGFYLTLTCDAPDNNYTCTFNSSQEVRLFGARVELDDTSNPVPSTISGPLTSEPRFAGPLDITLNATDTGAGVYRVLLLVDDQVAASQVIDANGGACADVNTGNSDAYEFGSQTPCKGSAGGTFTFEPSQLPDGAHNLKVQVEDAAGNAATVVNRPVTIVAGRGALNGANASDAAQLTVRWTRTRRATLRTRSPRRAVLTGRLVNEAGQPIAGARLDLITRTTVPGSRERAAPNGVVTRPSGRFTVRMSPRATSRDVRIAYRSHANDTAPVAQRTMRLRVRARLRLSARPRQARLGTVVRFRGRLLSRPIPRRGKQIVLQGRAGRSRWQNFDVVRTDRRGHFRARYRFRTSGRGTYSFRAVSRYEAAYPYIAGHSRTVRVVKR